MKNILVPIDFSEYAENALYMAANIAKRDAATIHVVHMLGIMDAILDRMDDQTSLEVVYNIQLAEKKLEAFLDKDYLKGLDVQVIIRKTKIMKELPLLAKELNADLIVMGSHGSSGWDEVFVGSNTQKVVRHSNIPVMVIKHKMVGFDIQRAIFACDFDTNYIESFKKACHFFNVLDVKLHLVYVNTSGHFKSTKELKQQIDSFLKIANHTEDLTYESVYIYNDYSVEKGIFNYATEIRAGVIGMATHGRARLNLYFEHRIEEEVVNHSHFPMVTFSN